MAGIILYPFRKDAQTFIMVLQVIRIFLSVHYIIFYCFIFSARCFADNALKDSEIGMGGFPVVVLEKEAQKKSGILTTKAKRFHYQPEFKAFGKALNIQPLLVLRNKYLLTLTDSRSAQAKFAQSEQSIQRVKDLYRNGIAAKRRLQEEQAQWQVDRSQADAAHFQARTIAGEAQLIWGEKLSSWVVSSESSQIDPFITGKKTLLHIILPAYRQMPDDIQIVFVDAAGDRTKAQEARFISKAPQGDYAVQGFGYFFETRGDNVRAGMTVTVWVPEQKSTVTGIVIPKSSVLRTMDQVFVYVKTGVDQFSRRILAKIEPAPGGYFVGDGIKAGEEVVTIGGQMLMSEELRGQIPEDDD